MAQKKTTLTFEQTAAAEEHLRFVLNTVEGVLVTLGSTVDAARNFSQAQPETRKAFYEARKALDKAYSSVTTERRKASENLRARALKDAK